MVPDLDASVQIGEVLAGKYRVERVLGVGGMGVVVAATHLQLGQMVALKFIRRQPVANPEIIARFEREARAAASLRSEHVAHTIDIGQLETGSPYIVMEYLEGDNLASLLRRQGKVPAALACDFIIQACEALAEAHSLGIVHRDLKPGNLFLANLPHGRRAIKVLDFGISKSPSSSDPSMTDTQELMGSPGYMSPEQMRSAKNVDGRSDLWSLGVILYELVTGQRPFVADTLAALCFKITTEPPPRLPALPALDPGLEPVIRRALEKDPAVRHQSAAELAHALAPFVSAESRALAFRLLSVVAAVTPTPSDAGSLSTPSVVTTLNGAAGESQLRPARSRKLLFGGIAVGAALGVGIAVAHGPASGGADPTVPQASPPTPDRTPRPEPEGARPAQQPSPRPAAAPPPSAPVPRATPEPTIEPGPAATRAETGPSRDPDPAQTEGSNATTRKKSIEATPKPTRKRTRPRDKGKPTKDSFDPFGSPD